MFDPSVLHYALVKKHYFEQNYQSEFNLHSNNKCVTSLAYPMCYKMIVTRVAKIFQNTDALTEINPNREPS